VAHDISTLAQKLRMVEAAIANLMEEDIGGFSAGSFIVPDGPRFLNLHSLKEA